RLHPRRGVLLHRSAELRGLAAAPAAFAARRAGADRAVLVVQLRAPRSDQAYLCPLSPALHAVAAGHARVAGAGVRLRRPALVLALYSGDHAIGRRGRPRAAPYLV